MLTDMHINMYFSGSVANYKDDPTAWTGGGGKETAESAFQNMFAFILSRLGDPRAKQSGDLSTQLGIAALESFECFSAAGLLRLVPWKHRYDLILHNAFVRTPKAAMPQWC